MQIGDGQDACLRSAGKRGAMMEYFIAPTLRLALKQKQYKLIKNLKLTRGKEFVNSTNFLMKTAEQQDEDD